MVSLNYIGNFKRVKQGRLDDYQIKKYQSNVVADEFRYGSAKNVVVALENDVLMVNKRELQKVSLVDPLLLPVLKMSPSAYSSVPVNSDQATPFQEPIRQLAILDRSRVAHFAFYIKTSDIMLYEHHVWVWGIQAALYNNLSCKRPLRSDVPGRPRPPPPPRICYPLTDNRLSCEFQYATVALSSSIVGSAFATSPSGCAASASVDSATFSIVSVAIGFSIAAIFFSACPIATCAYAVPRNRRKAKPSAPSLPNSSFSTHPHYQYQDRASLSVSWARH